MNVLRIILPIIILYLFYYFGVWIQTSLNLFVPGSIIGMLLFFLLLTTNVLRVDWIEKGTQFLLSNMPLLFVPVTVGIISYLELFSGKGFVLVVVVLVSSAIVMISAGWIAQWLLKGEVNTDD